MQKLTIEDAKKHLDDITELNEEINSDFYDKITNTIFQRREYFKHVATLSLLILGLAPFLFNKVHHPKIFYAGIILETLVVIITTSYIRWLLDSDQAGLIKSRDEYGGMLQEEMGSLRALLAPGSFSESDYIQKMRPVYDKMREIQEQHNQESKSVPVDYTGDYLNFFFVLGFIGLLASIIPWQINLPAATVSILIIFLLTFFFPSKLFVWLGYPISWMKHKATKND